MGLLAGFFAALFGVGGGIVMVPLLVLLAGFEPKAATATSLAAIILTASVSVATHGALGNVAWGYALLIAAPALGGVVAGVAIKNRISSRNLTYGFAGLLAVLAIWLVLKPVLGDGGGDTPDLTALRAVVVVVLGGVAGVLAGLFGVGGGILFVPALTLVAGVPQLPAEGASLLAIIPVAMLGSWRQRRAGTIRWSAATTMALASIATAVAGAFVAEALPGRVLQAMFAGLLLVTAWQLVARAPRA